MPELPDVTVYVETLAHKLQGARLLEVRLFSPFLLRSVEPPLSEVHGRRIDGFSRLGKRIVWHLEGELFLVVHLMIAGRLQWSDTKKKPPGKIGLAAFDTDRGTVLFTEAGTKRRASLYVVAGRAALAEHDRGGLEPLACSVEGFRDALRRENHTLKRALTDPRFISGIGNAYSDEILFEAKLSPFLQTAKIDDETWARLYDATRAVLTRFTDAIRAEAGHELPKKVTAFRPDMRVHGRYGEPCVVCGAKVQRIVHAENESNYCAACQNAGRLFADRGLSRLLKDDWPRSLDELEALKATHKAKILGE